MRVRLGRYRKGRADGEAKGRMDSLQLAVETVCEVLGIEIDVERKNALR